MIALAVGSVDFVITTFHFKLFNIHRLQHFHAKPPGLLGNALGKLLSTNAFREAGEVVETNGDASLPAESGALDQQRGRTLARRIDRGSQAGRPAPDDDQIGVTL